MEQRFNLTVCCRLCEKCHCDVTEHRVRILFEPFGGFERLVTFNPPYRR